jgi:lipopolysaccharide biosynthesis glycosyltransferase
MDKNNTITIVSVTDNYFIVLLAALLKSIEVNHVSGEKIDFYIVEDKVSASNKRKLEASVESEQITLHWISIETVIPSHVKLPKDSSDFPSNIYARLFIPYFIPVHIEKVVYLDVDMILKKDISDLWNIDIHDKIIAGVVDRLEVVSNSWAGIKNYKELGLNPESKYFNSGLLLIKPQEWRSGSIAEKIIECIQENRSFADFPDQYGLNVVFADQWYELDKRWNTYSFSNEPEPFIIHFMARKPIYKSYNYNEEYRRCFFEYLGQTGWKDFRPVDEINRLGKKVFHRITKRLTNLLK